MISVITPSEPLKLPQTNARVPAHLYKRKGLYYFRVVISDKLRQRLECSELRLSLRTAYRRNALELSWRLHIYFHELLESYPMLTYKEIRRRLNIYLQRQLERNHDNIMDRPSVKDYFILAENHPDYTEADVHRHHAETFQEMLTNPGSFEHLADAVKEELLRCRIFLMSEFGKDNLLRIVKAYLESQVTYYRLLEKKCQGDFQAEEAIVAADFGELPKSTLDEEFKKLVLEEKVLSAKREAKEKAVAEESKHGSLPQLKPSMLYSEAIQAFIKDKVNGKHWEPHMVSEHEGQLKDFLDIMGDMAIGKIDRATMRTYRDILSELPPNRTRVAKYRGKTIPEILEMNPNKVLSSTRVNTLVQAVSSFLDWFVKEGVLSKNVAEGLQILDEQQAIDRRQPFEIKDLEKIFSHPKFAQGKFKFADYFWPPLISLFSGMRREEICQLHCKDIYEVNGIWVMDINERELDEKGDKKTTKTFNAARLVPLHNTLIDLGFLRYVKYISGKKSIRVFPNLNKSEKVGKYGKQVGKQFNDLVKDVLIAPDYDSKDKVFHSLRHNFSDFYKQRGQHDDVFRQLYGHDIPELAARQYGSRFPPEMLNKVIQALDYGIDFSFLKESKYIKMLTPEEK